MRNVVASDLKNVMPEVGITLSNHFFLTIPSGYPMGTPHYHRNFLTKKRVVTFMLCKALMANLRPLLDWFMHLLHLIGSLIQ